MIQLQLSNLEVLVAKLRQVPGNIRSAVVDAMQRITIDLQRYVITEKLEGQVLQHRTGNLERSIVQSVVEDGATVIGVVGVSQEAFYGKIHEFGGVFTIREHLSTSRLGNQFSVATHNATFPERSFMRTSLAENEESIRAKLGAAVTEGARA